MSGCADTANDYTSLVSSPLGGETHDSGSAMPIKTAVTLLDQDLLAKEAIN